MLFEYQKTIQRLVRDQSQKLLSPDDLVSYINRARRLVATETQCVRMVPPTQGSISSITITNPGAFYTSPTLTFSQPDSPPGTKTNPQGVLATGTIGLSGGTISTITLTNPGGGYFQPVATITDVTGSGGALSISTSATNNLAPFQEIYSFSDAPLPTGISAILDVIDVAIIFSNQRYSPRYYPFSVYQAKIRSFPNQYYYVPAVYTKLTQGTSGSLYFYPVPSQPYQCEWDCVCLPSDLASDTDTEVIPPPWQDAVPFYALHLAYLEMQNFNAARMYLELYDNLKRRQSAGARTWKTTNFYGRS